VYECAGCDEGSVWVDARVANDRWGRLYLKFDTLGACNVSAHMP